MARTVAAREAAAMQTELVHFRHTIDGQLVDSVDGRTFASVDPSTGHTYATAAEGGREDARRAVAAARRAFDDGPWPRLSTGERRRLLNRLADRIDERAEELAAAESRDMGKPIHESRGHDLPRVARNFRFFADFQDLDSTAEQHPMPGFHTYTRYEPKGVAVAISPWNFPLMLASWKVAPALAYGNTVVLKPAEESPATAAMLGELASELLPPGVLNVVHGFGPDAAGDFLVRDPGVDLVTFTGASLTGQAIMEACSADLKGVSLELGGKSPNVVFADADLDAAVAGTIRGIFGNQGEVCLAGSRLLVERSVHDDFLDRLTAATEALTIGDPLDEATQLGPLISEEHRGKVESYVELAVADGGELISGGMRPDDPALQHGYYLRPTIVANVPQRSRACQEEIFGPVLVTTPFDSEEQAIELANGTDYGLASMVWTENLSRAHRVAAALDAGVVWVNCFFVRDLRAPFGGTQRSGVGREGGVFSRDFFTEPKAITIKIDGLDGVAPSARRVRKEA
jgi:aminomuconate-semialdehyde/2-hydroxymuconate-6-semialdehyde dehydrogenase